MSDSGAADRRLDRGVAAVIGLAAAAYAAFLLASPLEALTFRSTDDSYYYFGVARNWVAGRGLSFDGINPTNGFHPLWMLLLLPIYALAGGDGEWGLRAAFLLVTVVGAVVVWLAYVALSRVAGRAAAMVVLCGFASPFLLNPLLNGLETGLMLLALLATLLAVLRFDLTAPRSPLAHNLLFGLLLSLLFLARLDTVFLGGALVALAGLRWAAGEGGVRSASVLVRKLAPVFAVGLVLVGAYLLWNRLNFGHWVPISGALKSTFPEVSFNPRRLTAYHDVYGLGQLLVSAAILAWAWLARRTAWRSSLSPLLPVLTALWVGSLLHTANTLLFMPWGVHWWHYASYLPVTLLLLAMAIAAGLERSTRPARLAAVGAAAVLLFSVATLWLDVRYRGVEHREWYRGALWAREHLPAAAVVGMTDCGLFGYFADRPTVNLDGVINGYAYQRALAEGRLGEFLQRCRVTHVAAHGARYREGRYLIPLPARLHRAPGGALVAPVEAEIYGSSEHANITGDTVQFTIWRFEGVQVVEDLAAYVAAGGR